MLKAIVDSLENVDAAFHSLYTERNGKFEITGIEGMKTQGDVDRLTVSLNKERDEHKATKTALNVFNGIDGTDIHTKLDRLAELELTGGKIDEGKVEELVSARLNTKTAPLEREIASLREANETLTGQVGEFEKQNSIRTIQDDVRKAFANQKLTDGSAQEDAMLHAMNLFQIDEQGNVVTQDGMTTTQWLESMKTSRSYWWGESHGGGAPGSKNKATGTNPWAKDSLNLTEQGKIIRTDRVRAEQLAKAAGVTITGQPLK